MATTTCLNDDEFGPIVKGCRNDFDFTVKFELIILSLVPNLIFILVALLRCLQLHKRANIVNARLFQATKLIFLSANAALHFSRLVYLKVAGRDISSTVSLASGAIGLIASLITVLLSLLEHRKSRRPSMLLSIYLFLTLLLDTARIRTLWLTVTSQIRTTNARLFTASVALKVVILLLESKQKTAWLQWDWEKHSPEESSGFFDLGMFTWLKQLFLAGFSSVLAMDNLYSLDQDLSSETLHGFLNAHFDRNIPTGKKFRLAKALGRALLAPVLVPVLPRLILIGFTFSQPFFLAAVLDTVSHRTESGAQRDSIGLIGAAVFIYTGIALSRAFYGYFTQRAIAMARGCLVSAVYEKTLETQVLAGDDAAAVTLMSTDIERIASGMENMHDMWANILEAGLGCWLLQRKLGFAFLSPVIVIVCCGGIMAWVSRAATRAQTSWMAKIQSRVGMTSKVIMHVKQVKISGIAEPVERFIQALRVEELLVGSRFRVVLVVTVTVAFAPQSLSPFLAFALADRNLDVSTMYESLSYLVLLAVPLKSFFQRFPVILSTFTCLGRIQEYLEAAPRRDFRVATRPYDRSQEQALGLFSYDTRSAAAFELRPLTSSSNAIGFSNVSNDVLLSVQHGLFAWSEGHAVLDDINITLRSSQLTFVIGPVASGKSSLCKAILGDIPVAAGEVRVHPSLSSIAFCDQVPYLVSGTLKQNIVGHLNFDQSRYDEVIHATALTEDIASLPHGHDSPVGIHGTTLSGGQKARVSLARALYDRSLLLVLDDVFSGLDNHTAARVFDRTFGPTGFLRRRGAAAVVCTHSLRHLSLADHVVVLGPQGTIVEQGPYQSLTYATEVINLGEPEKSDAITSLDNKDSLAHSSELTRPKNDDAFTNALDDRSRQLGDWKVYKHYFNSMNKLHLISMLVSCIFIAIGQQLPTVWVGFWAADSLNKPRSFYIGIYAMFSSFILVGVLVGAGTCFVLLTIGVGRELHRNALATVMHAPLRFFTSTDTGTITNLFSQDTAIIDSELSTYLLDFVFCLVGLIGSGIVVALASPYLAASYPVLLIIGYCVQMFYLRTSRQLRLLDLEAKSPLYSHFLDTIKGLASIRAFGWVEDEIKYNRDLLDTSQRPAYLLAMIQQCLMLVLNLIVAFMGVALVSLATQLRTSTGFTGASLISLMTFSELATGLIFTYTGLETSIGAVARLKTFSEKVQPEHQPGEDVVPPVEWPQSGSMVIQNVSASHSSVPISDTEKAVLALNNISLTVGAGEKIAVCGRSGSGKSSFILFLLRLLDPSPSAGLTFTIDSIDVLTTNRTTLRSRIIAVPQECVFLPDGSSIKSNIDPTETITDTECQHILEMVQLTAFVVSQGGLNAPMSGDQLSAGQQQLFSLGRAIYRRRAKIQTAGRDGGVLLLDEISSSVDRDTELLMHGVISREFAAYTIVAVAHRLELMVDFVDQVVVLDRGSVIEQGAPRDLLAAADGAFSRLYRAGH
ncbi:Canalicular multispecific organic anion transporter 1-like protein 2 [Stagonosporopsis vannaccii]|nr:Canalicular multispecific organic anion transporter 1-like protein 2 [Stagonosporopsis vannaccii]